MGRPEIPVSPGVGIGNLERFISYYNKYEAMREVVDLNDWLSQIREVLGLTELVAE